jgi:hypothetical protein
LLVQAIESSDQGRTWGARDVSPDSGFPGERAGTVVKDEGIESVSRVEGERQRGARDEEGDWRERSIL